MIDSKKVLYSAGNNDECYTPSAAVRPIIKYIPEGSVVWCPFDTDSSEYVRELRAAGFSVINTHLNSGHDFYNYDPENDGMKWDVMVSNPPYTGKRKIFERALSFGKPFALLMSLTWLNDSAPKQLFRLRPLELLMFDKRIKYFKPDGTVENKITFSSAYYCHGVLPRQIIMESLA